MKTEIQTKKFYMHKISNLLNIQKIVTIHYQALGKNYVFPEEKHDFWEINYADKETTYIGIDGQKIELKQGEIIFIKPNQPHFVESGDKEPNIFIISFSCRSESMSFFADKKYRVPENYRYLLQNIMSEAESTFDLPDFDPHLNELKLKESPNLGGEQIIKNSLENLLIYLLRNAQQKSLQQEFFVSKIADSSELQDEIVRILRSKIYSKFTLADLSNELHYGTTRLCTFFREKTGKSIYQTYLKLKIDEAKKLIRKHKSFAEIADLLCFDSISTFAFVFKKHTGMTPSEYRNSIK
ncbi:MAG: helix-turn-helix transcriptional regulator [Clostridia bacterium]|nr:helix-turn-helix transcriptional regulator [Clostridia bacterium]